MATEITEIKENAGLCYQCAKCSTGCPISDEMDMLPHQVIHLLSLGMGDRALDKNTIWICAGCYTCAVRCPNDINITAVMDDLRAQALEAGLPCPNPEVLKFHRAFLNDVARRGRIHEMRMMGEYNMRILKPFKDALLAPRMILTRRLHILPPRNIKGFKKWMRKIWKNR